MSSRTTLLIVILFFLTCGLLYLALRTPTYQKKQVVSGPTPTPISVNAHTTLSLMAASASESSKIATHTIAVVIDTTNSVNGVQIELSYDPTALTNVTLAPGSFFQQPNALLKNVNTTDGRISYALAEQPSVAGHQGHGTVALVSFDILPTYTKPTTMVSFLPKTAVAADKIMESVLKKTSGLTITVVSPSPSTTQPLGTGSAR